MDLTEFLLARIAEDEEVAREATNDGHRWLVEEETIGLWPDDHDPAAGFMHFPRKAHAYHAATWNPARVLAECEAKRRIVEIHAAEPEEWGMGCTAEEYGVRWPCGTIKALALPYADHPDHRDEWKP